MILFSLVLHLLSCFGTIPNCKIAFCTLLRNRWFKRERKLWTRIIFAQNHFLFLFNTFFMFFAHFLTSFVHFSLLFNYTQALLGLKKKTNKRIDQFFSTCFQSTEIHFVGAQSYEKFFFNPALPAEEFDKDFFCVEKVINLVELSQKESLKL